jgi:starch synthase
MRVAFLAAEATPFIKAGGLGDVAGELPPALSELGLEVRLFLPYHPALRQLPMRAEKLLEFDLDHALGGERAQVYRAAWQGAIAYLIDGEPLRDAQAVYTHPSADARRFAFYSLASLEAMRRLEWRPELIHAHDWHASFAVIWLGLRGAVDPFWASVKTILTVHNLPYMGAGAEEALALWGLLPAADERLPIWGRIQPLPLGLLHADWISTVSPTYAREIQTPEFGCGLENFLRQRADRLTGILNGIDTGSWNPETDSSLPAPFSSRKVSPRRKNKSALQETLDLPPGAKGPLIGMITRLDFQKGVDIALHSMRDISDQPWQFVLLGTGDAALEDSVGGFAAEFTDRARALIRFDPDMARLIYAGSDLLLVPSRYEPCGLSQMIGLRYGAVPLVRATGGLRDTVVDADTHPDGNGFAFGSPNPEGMSDALRRALQAFVDPPRWKALQRRGMKFDFSWRRSAQAYQALYRRALET